MVGAIKVSQNNQTFLIYFVELCIILSWMFPTMLNPEKCLLKVKHMPHTLHASAVDVWAQTQNLLAWNQALFNHQSPWLNHAVMTINEIWNKGFGLHQFSKLQMRIWKIWGPIRETAHVDWNNHTQLRFFDCHTYMYVLHVLRVLNMYFFIN